MPSVFTITGFVLMLGVCVVASITDIRTKLVPNKLTGPAMGAGLLLWAVAGLVAGKGLLGDAGAIQGTLAGSFVALMAGLVPFVALVFVGGLGMGDAKLMGAVGALSGQWQVVLGTAIYALLAAAVMGVFTMVRAGRTKLTMYRMLGIALSGGKAVKPDEDPDSPTVPFAVAIAIGGFFAGAELMVGLWPKNPWIWP